MNKKITIISSGNKEIFNFATPVGIGLIDSAINLTRIVLFDKPDIIFFIGTAGSYGKLKVFDIIETSSASNIEQCLITKSCYTPVNNMILSDVSRETIINSSNYITTNVYISKKYLELNIDAENMEFFSIVKIAKKFNIYIRGIFIITNYCNENAHKDYIQNINKAKEKLIKYLINKKIIKEIDG